MKGVSKVEMGGEWILEDWLLEFLLTSPFELNLYKSH